MTPDDLDRAAEWNREAAIRAAYKINHLGQYGQENPRDLSAVVQAHVMMVGMLRREAWQARRQGLDQVE